MDADDIAWAREFILANPRGILTTFRRDGRVQTSPVTPGIDAQGRVIVSVTADRAKTRNARRDPRVALCVFSEKFYGPWTQVEGDAELVEGAEGVEALVDYYRRLSGEHEDWADYRAAMVRDRRVLLRFEITRAVKP
ncbi:MAG TPA: PPOX class F420-dependent oxidoreductase [Actinocrinis sp.]|nr:PPOX class F420-dependent oxidoreductase [Actinocrinis sp.]